MKAAAFEICLSHIVAEYADVDECQNILRKGKVVLTIPVINAWPEKGTSPVNGLKLELETLSKLIL